MAISAAARRYAKALYQLAEEDGAADRVRGELDAFAKLMDESSELRTVLLEPLYPVAERHAVLKGLAERLDASPVIRNFYSFLIDQRRLVDFGGIRAEYQRLVDQQAGVTQARVVAASPLRDEQLARLTSALAARTGKQVTVEVDVDPSLLGGVVAQVGDLVFDGSLRTQLSQLRSTLMKG